MLYGADLYRKYGADLYRNSQNLEGGYLVDGRQILEKLCLTSSSMMLCS